MIVYNSIQKCILVQRVHNFKGEAYLKYNHALTKSSIEYKYDFVENSSSQKGALLALLNIYSQDIYSLLSLSNLEQPTNKHYLS